MMLFKRHLGSSRTLALITDVTDDMIHDGISMAALQDMDYVSRASGPTAFWVLLARTLADETISSVAVSLNRNCVLDSELMERVELACVRATEASEWAVLAATGLCMDANTFSVVYPSAAPRLFAGSVSRPIVDCGLELFLLDANFLRSQSERFLDANMPPDHFPQWCILTGYLDGRVSMFRPELAIGVDGSERGRDASKLALSLGQAFSKVLPDESVPSLAGSISINPQTTQAADDRNLDPRHRLLARPLRALADLVRQAALKATTPMSLSVVTRTRFTREHLLRRMLASLTRARQEADLSLEVVLSTDVEESRAQEAHRVLQADFPELELVLKLNSGQYPHSRVDNLVGGILAARRDYVAIVDDDDFVGLDAFWALSGVRFGGQNPLLLMSSQLRDEVWSETTTGRWILESSVPSRTYHARNFRGMFQGSNQLPVCAIAAPRIWLQTRLSELSLRHDLSEDYAIYLALLTSPDMPPLLTSDNVFCMISSRSDGSNTITMKDRRPWVRDITLFLHDLFVANPVSGSSTLQLLAQVAKIPANNAARFTAATTDESVSRQSREIAVLKAEVAHFRSLVSEMQSSAREGSQTSKTAQTVKAASKH